MHQTRDNKRKKARREILVFVASGGFVDSPLQQLVEPLLFSSLEKFELFAVRLIGYNFLHYPHHKSVGSSSGLSIAI